ncbi:GspH/FimT family pseudopilin [Lysobacter sp. TAF61]|uniref:GspH/FimT family pseudopilin n=1 Tax=Lysobacter sp. TAF61 TaxID=3233072 RepID=UPI003F9AAECB
MPFSRQHTRRSQYSARNQERGFTLVELAITLAVLAVLMSVAIPGFRLVQNSSRLSAAANELVGSLQSARMEAIRRNGRVVICSSADGATCSGVGTSQGWVVFADADADSSVDSGEEIILATAVPTPLTIKASSAVTEGIVMFRSDGMARNKGGQLLTGQIRICMAATVPADNVRNVAIGAGGRVRVERDSTAGVCN